MKISQLILLIFVMKLEIIENSISQFMFRKIYQSCAFHYDTNRMYSRMEIMTNYSPTLRVENTVINAICSVPLI